MASIWTSDRPRGQDAPEPIDRQTDSLPHGHLRNSRSALMDSLGTPGHRPRPNFWDQLEDFTSGSGEHDAERSLVSTRRPWAPNTEQQRHPNPGGLNGQEPQATSPEVAAESNNDPVRRLSEHLGNSHSEHSPAAAAQRRSFRVRPLSGDRPRGLKGEERGGNGLTDPEVPNQMPDAATTTTRVDLVYDPSQASRDMSVRLVLDVEEDWEHELEEFCRLKRLGLIKEAKEHFWSRLGHVSTIPYIRVQYAEMLQSCGDFKSLQCLDFLPEFPPDPWEETTEDRNRGKLVANHTLLDFLSQRPISDYVTAAWSFVRQTLKALASELVVGSTEIQMIVLCLRVLGYLKTCTSKAITGPVRVYAKHLFDWRRLYNDLVGESCVWDFKDLFLACVSVFGWPETIEQFFGTTHTPLALDTIIKDWNGEPLDEASMMGLLDLFTSPVLQSHIGRKARKTLLMHHAKALADSVEQNKPELMKTRPFIQWLLAKTAHELEAPPERPDGVRMEHFGGLKLDQGAGIHLPIYVPTRHSRKPDWDMFFFRSTPAQRRVVELAVRTAEQIGDYALQAEAMKLLILQSQDPWRLMSALASLQLETQGDKEGYLSTCLSMYLVATDLTAEANLLRDLERPCQGGNMLLFEQCENASLTWAWVMIRILLASSINGDAGSDTTTDSSEEPSPFLARRLHLDGTRLAPYIAEFGRAELGIDISPPMEPLSVDDRIEEPDYSDDQRIAALRRRFARGASEAREASPRANPWPYYTGQESDPLAHGISPSVRVNGWPSTWYEDAQH